MSRWQVHVDTGGTFTDCVARDGAGGIHRVKVLSSGALRGRVTRVLDDRRVEVEQKWGVADDFVRGFRFRSLDTDHDPVGPVAVAGFDATASVLELAGDLAGTLTQRSVFELDSGVEAPILAARMVTATPSDADLPPVDMRLATTRGTNALLERGGVAVGLFITRGFGDLMIIGDQQRSDLFALRIDRPAPLYEAVVEVRERLAADGSVIRAVDMVHAEREARGLLGRGVRCAAVGLLHGYRNPDHERALAKMLLEIGFEHVSCSSDLSPLIKIVPRCETAVVNAYLAPLIEGYLRDIEHGLSGGGLHVMTSAGGLVGAGACRARDSLLSGPAGGVAGAVAVARRSGFAKIISFDMGGTSTDVARYDGDFEYQFEHRVGSTRLVAPALAIETVAAGGGSICTVVDGEMRVGPESASAWPGPACYGAGGPLTITDVNLLLGRLEPDRFEIPISVDAARHALDTLRGDADAAKLLPGFLEIANQRMADAIAEVSLRRGYDPREYALVAFGGAGGQHACAVADQLGIETIVMPADASLLSAVGLGRAVVERFAHGQVLEPLAEVAGRLPAMLDELGRGAVAEVVAEGIPQSRVEVRRKLVNLRLTGQETSIEVPMGPDLGTDFAARYQSMYGHQPG